MGLTVSIVERSIIGNKRCVIADLTYDSSYPTGGEPLVPGDLGLARIDTMLTALAGGYLHWYDQTNQKLLARYPTDIADLTFAGDALAAHGHAFTGTPMAAQSVTVKDDDTAATLGTPVSARMIDGYFAKLESPNANGADSNFATAGGRLPVFVPRRHSLSVPVEDLGAGVDISARSIWAAPASGAALLKAGIVGSGSGAGIDAGNSAVVLLTDGAGNTIVTKTYDDDPAWPADGVYDNLGALDATHSILTGNEVVKLSVTLGATANTPPFVVVIEWEEQEALFPVYFDEDAAAGSRFLINNGVNGLDLFVVASDGRLVKLTHSANAAADGVRCYFDDDGATALEKLVFVSPTNANGSEPFSTSVEAVGRVAAGTNATTSGGTPAGSISGEADVVGGEVPNATNLSAVTVRITAIGN